MGTEMGQAYFRSEPVSLLPSWWTWPCGLKPDGDEGAEETDGAATPVAGYSPVSPPGPSAKAAVESEAVVFQPKLELDGEGSEHSVEIGPVHFPHSPGDSVVHEPDPSSPVHLDDVADMETDESGMGDESRDTSHLFPNCIYIPGMLHLMHNLSWDLTEAMDHWPEFYPQLKNAAAILCSPDLLRRLISECISGSQHDPPRQPLCKACKGKISRACVVRFCWILAFVSSKVYRRDLVDDLDWFAKLGSNTCKISSNTNMQPHCVFLFFHLGHGGYDFPTLSPFIVGNNMG
jgi:hypothetical protein